MSYIEAKTNEYLTQLDQNDVAENPLPFKDVQQKLERLKQNKIKYEVLQQELEQSTQSQISTTDTDARALLVQGQVVEVSYNVQAAVDHKHKLVAVCSKISPDCCLICGQQIWATIRQQI